ncbi:fungal-specific transcription factor domain-containing protein [Aspergillus floccosus]
MCSPLVLRKIPDKPFIFPKNLSHLNDLSFPTSCSSNSMNRISMARVGQARKRSANVPESESGLVNPLASGPPAFMSPGNGRMYYLGTSSNWSFTRRVLSLTHQHVHKVPLPTEALVFEGTAYELDWDGSRIDPILEGPVIPTLDYALYLVNTVKFRCGQLYHIFDDSDFMESLHAFYSENGPTRTRSLWYIHFLLILALGRTFIQTKSHEKKPPGISYFVKALHILPDHNRLYASPMTATEILCCIAIFYQALDCRSPAHNYVGQAMRLAMAHGMHTCMPVTELGHDVVERCRKIWWTVYILDRYMTSVQGLPQSMDDRFIQTNLPSFEGSPDGFRSLGMHVRLCRSMADINSTVYAIDGRINRTFLLSTKAALANMAGQADELYKAFPLHLEGPDNGMSRTSAFLHLFYQQCVIVATRPLLFCFLKIRLESPETCVQFLHRSQNVWNLIKACIESAQHSIRILHDLKTQGLLETFLTFDLESIFISTVVLLMGPAIDLRFEDDNPWWLGRAYAIFQEMVEAGNQIARFRWSELQQLEGTLHAILHNQAGLSDANAISQYSDATPQLPPPLMSGFATSVDQGSCTGRPLLDEATSAAESAFGHLMTSAEMMAMAGSIDLYDAEWVSTAMDNHDIW